MSAGQLAVSAAQLAVYTLRDAAKAAKRGDLKKSAALVRVAEEYRLLAETERRPVGFGGADR